MLDPFPSRLLAMLLTFAAGAAAQNPITDALAAFGKRPVAEQQKVLAGLDAQLQQHANPWTTALAARIADGRTTSPARHVQMQQKTPKKKPPPHDRVVDPWLPASVRYVFGTGAIEMGVANGKSGAAPHDKAAAAASERKDRLHTALAGMLPDTDLAVADIERELDRDTSADAFAAFLVAWHHEDETFYEALDRTAGTPDSLFYYDAMLADFAGAFADGKDAAAAKVRSSLEQQHDALHRAFLAYRQYRAFREAVALSLVLPVEQPLPHHLARYEAPAEGAYSLRQQLLMVLACEDWDVQKVVAAITASAPALPQPLWSADYDPFPAWQRIFSSRLEQMIEREGDTDKFLAAARAQLHAWNATIATAAQDALTAPAR